jgi:4a-hydroxytetrahydrobiopterin dehydratase
MDNLKIPTEQVAEFISENKFWSLKENKLHREFVFKDFITAFGFMTQIAIVAECANHHPEWSNTYQKVVVDLTTHELNQISVKDFKLAKTMDIIADKLLQ